MTTTRCDEAYASPSPSFWGVRPTSLVRELAESRPVAGLRVLDAGCGEGRNAVYLAERGAEVTAVDSSATALSRATALFGAAPGVSWKQADVTVDPLPVSWYDVVVVYSVTHWLAGDSQVRAVVARLREATRPGGVHLFCAFNDRLPYPHAAGHAPVLLPHLTNLALYDGWEIVRESDTDLADVHPGEPPHVHAMSRIVARRVR
jgi:SAM-dependent methyltransferase